MDAVRTLRRARGLTQAELADAAGTSQPTVAAYEGGRKSPTLRTLERMANAVGLEAHVAFHPPLTREERRSLALHRAIADELMADPEHVLELAGRNLRLMQGRTAQVTPLLREWAVLLQRPLVALLPVLVDPSPWARELRHVTPFAGVLSNEDRTRVLQSFQREEGVRK